MTRATALTALFGVLLPCLNACERQGSTTSGEAGAKKIFRFRLTSEPTTLDWNRAHTPVETHLMVNLMEGLLGFDEKLNLVPELARGYTRSPDGKKITFELRRGVKWSDGIELKAHDFVYSWKRLLTASTAASYAYLLFDIVNAKQFYDGKIKDFNQVGVKAVGDYELEVTLNEPLAHWLQVVTFWVTYPLREDIVKRHGQDWVSPGKMVTLGPFQLAEYEIDSRIRLTRNPYYRDRSPSDGAPQGNVDEVIGLIVKDDSTAITLFETADLDLTIDVPTLDLERLKGRPELKAFPYLKTVYLGFTQSHSDLQSVEFRRAIAHAIDRSKFGEILHSGQTEATSFVSPPIRGSGQASGPKYDPVAAKKWLAKARLKKAVPEKLEILTLNRDRNLTVAQYLQAELRKTLGLKVEIVGFDNKVFRATLAQKTYPLFLNSWSADYPDAENYLTVFLSHTGNNWVGYKNPEYDRLVAEARIAIDPEKRLGFYKKAEKLLLEDAIAILPLFYEPNPTLVRTGVSGVVLNPLNCLFLKNVRI